MGFNSFGDGLGGLAGGGDDNLSTKRKTVPTAQTPKINSPNPAIPRQLGAGATNSINPTQPTINQPYTPKPFPNATQGFTQPQIKQPTQVAPDPNATSTRKWTTSPSSAITEPSAPIAPKPSFGSKVLGIAGDFGRYAGAPLSALGIADNIRTGENNFARKVMGADDEASPYQDTTNWNKDDGGFVNNLISKATDTVNRYTTPYTSLLKDPDIAALHQKRLGEMSPADRANQRNKDSALQQFEQPYIKPEPKTATENDLLVGKYRSGNDDYKQNLTRDNMSDKSIGFLGENVNAAGNRIAGEFSTGIERRDFPISNSQGYPALSKFDDLENLRGYSNPYQDVPTLTPNQSKEQLAALKDAALNGIPIDDKMRGGIDDNAKEYATQRAWQGKKPFANITETMLNGQSPNVQRNTPAPTNTPQPQNTVTAQNPVLPSPPAPLVDQKVQQTKPNFPTSLNDVRSGTGYIQNADGKNGLGVIQNQDGSLSLSNGKTFGSSNENKKETPEEYDQKRFIANLRYNALHDDELIRTGENSWSHQNKALAIEALSKLGGNPNEYKKIQSDYQLGTQQNQTQQQKQQLEQQQYSDQKESPIYQAEQKIAQAKLDMGSKDPNVSEQAKNYLQIMASLSASHKYSPVPDTQETTDPMGNKSVLSRPKVAIDETTGQTVPINNQQQTTNSSNGHYEGQIYINHKTGRLVKFKGGQEVPLTDIEHQQVASSNVEKK